MVAGAEGVMTAPKVSVCIITYNHAKYVRECLDSVLAQRTDFPFEIVIGDDCSPDGTGAIIAEYAQRHPDIIRPLLHDPHVGGAMNYMLVYQEARGEFIAHLDGDDLMLPGRLQKQHDFLVAHPECSFVGHKLYILSEDGRRREGVTPAGDQPETSTVERLVTEHLFFGHSSKMVRRAVQFHHGRTKDNVNLIDFTMHVEHATLGRVGFINEVLGEYRQGVPNSLSTARSGARLHGGLKATLYGFDRALELGVDPEVVSQGRANYLFGAAMHCVRHGDLEGMATYLRGCAACPAVKGLLPRLGKLLAPVPFLAAPVLRFGLWLRDRRDRTPATSRGAA
jgi:glycosyltransferase involved in cell wall biosynthesis